MSWLRNEPTVFRMPTSFARFSLRAVLRFIKLMQQAAVQIADDRKQPHKLYASSGGFAIFKIAVQMPFIHWIQVCSFNAIGLCIFMTITMFLIFSVSLSISILSANCAKHCQEWLFHSVAASFTHCSVVIYFFQGRKYFESYKVLLSGKSWYTPATL